MQRRHDRQRDRSPRSTLAVRVQPVTVEYLERYSGGVDGAIPNQLEWARLNADIACGLRRGAWYRVIRATDTGVLLDVNRSPLTIAESLLQIRTVRPRRWSIVSRPAHAPRLPTTWGSHYAVCPICRTRAQMLGYLFDMRCPCCSGMFEIAWDEREPPDVL